MRGGTRSCRPSGCMGQVQMTAALPGAGDRALDVALWVRWSFIGGDPARDRWPILFEGTRTHEQPDMPSGNSLFHNAGFRCSEIFGGIKDLLCRRDVVIRPRQQIDGTLDVEEIERATQPDEFAPGQQILFEDLIDDLKIPTPRQVDRVLVPALECLFLFEIFRVVHVLVEIDMVLNIMLPRVHVLPPLQHLKSGEFSPLFRGLALAPMVGKSLPGL